MKNSWTGGQYSIFRAVFATYLFVHFLQWISEGTDSFGMVTALRVLGTGLCVLLGIGFHDRAAALGICGLGACLPARDPILANPSFLCVGWLLMAHVFLPPAPYGSWAARGRVDPDGGWLMPPTIYAAAWIALTLGYACVGYTKLVCPPWRDNPVLVRPAWLLAAGTWTAITLEFTFVPLMLFRRLRPWLWGLMLLLYLPLLAFLDLTSLIPGMVMLHLFTWDPGWIRPLNAPTERLFYDGQCGLCQRSVRLILAEDSTGDAFRFAPLQGETFQSLVSPEERDALPLSLVVRTEKGALLTRSTAVLHIMRRLGGVWRLLAGLLVLFPTHLRDCLYDGVAHNRHRMFARPAEMCPLMPPRLQGRFDP
jgi:predicted DCC family thiol-disulfide oxidoreductase YuxK